MVIANTTIISNFASVGRLDLLRGVLDEVYISTDVFAEIQDGFAEGNLFYRGIEQNISPLAPDGWLQLTSLHGDAELQLFARLPAGLHRGEASSLAIAGQRNWVFLTDDAKARSTAHALGIAISGTLGLLLKATQAELITAEEADGLLTQMLQNGYRSPHSTISELL